MYLCGYLDTFSQAGQICCPSQVYTYTAYDASPSMRLPMLATNWWVVLWTACDDTPIKIHVLFKYIQRTRNSA